MQVLFYSFQLFKRLNFFQSHNDYLRQWLPKRNEYLKKIIEAEAPPMDGKCQNRDRPAIWRCKGCFGKPVFCTGCCKSSHKAHPFHRVEKWNGKFFEDAWLWQVGVVINLGHNGEPCPAPRDPKRDRPTPKKQDDQPENGNENDNEEWIDEPIDQGIPGTEKCLPPKVGSVDKEGNKTILIVDKSGVHHLGVHWCRCADKHTTDDLQLLEVGLMAATYKDVQTAFTFDVIDDYLATNVECHASAHHYFNKLRRLTSNVFPHTVPVRATIQIPTGPF